MFFNRTEIRQYISQVYTEICALKQGVPHAHLGALALPLDFNGFLSHLISGAPPTPRGAPKGGPLTPGGTQYTGASNTPRGLLGEGQELTESQQPHHLVTPEAAGAPTAAAAAAMGAPRSATPRVWVGAPSRGASHQHRRTASVGAPRRGPSPSPPQHWQEDPGGAPEEDDLLLHSCRSTGTDEEALPWRSPSNYHSGGPPKRGAPSYPTQWGQGAPGGSGPLRRPSPPLRVPPLAVPTEAPRGAPTGGGPQEYPEEYRVLAAQAREALETARRKMIERRGLGGPELYWDTRGGP